MSDGVSLACGLPWHVHILIWVGIVTGFWVCCAMYCWITRMTEE
jgi:hypothetical protein